MVLAIARMKLTDWCKKHSVRPSLLPALLRVKQQTVSRYLLEQRMPDPKIMQRIFEVTDGEVTPNDFYRLSTRKTKRAA
jgi:hypothetical protein